ncbi:hypothetical protein CEXT_437721 [Caerostris extrusa]|uniref:Uncharacterized protein n=1 Tax=Caerostris extrusa TaxID=172846 RepID=A0AAV4YAW1_CAEEX|nr:hypothetical protein CEXT_437721 [Caerostris extrusa]
MIESDLGHQILDKTKVDGNSIGRTHFLGYELTTPVNIKSKRTKKTTLSGCNYLQNKYKSLRETRRKLPGLATENCFDNRLDMRVIYY